MERAGETSSRQPQAECYQGLFLGCRQEGSPQILMAEPEASAPTQTLTLSSVNPCSPLRANPKGVKVLKEESGTGAGAWMPMQCPRATAQ